MIGVWWPAREVCLTPRRFHKSATTFSPRNSTRLGLASLPAISTEKTRTPPGDFFIRVRPQGQVPGRVVPPAAEPDGFRVRPVAVAEAAAIVVVQRKAAARARVPD